MELQKHEVVTEREIYLHHHHHPYDLCINLTISLLIILIGRGGRMSNSKMIHDLQMVTVMDQRAMQRAVLEMHRNQQDDRLMDMLKAAEVTNATRNAHHEEVMSSLQANLDQVREANSKLALDNSMLTKAVDQSLGMVEDQDDTIEAQRTICSLDPRITWIKRKGRQRAAEHEMEGEYTTRLDPDLGELIKRLGQFEHPTSYSATDLKRWLNGSIFLEIDGQE